MMSQIRLLCLLGAAAALAGCAVRYPSTYQFGHTAQNNVWQHGSLSAPNLP